MITEPRWKSYIVETTTPIFTPKQCQMIIKSGREEPKQTAEVGNEKNDKKGVLDTETRTSHISWIPFKKMGIPSVSQKICKAVIGDGFLFQLIS